MDREELATIAPVPEAELDGGYTVITLGVDLEAEAMTVTTSGEDVDRRGGSTVTVTGGGTEITGEPAVPLPGGSVGMTDALTVTVPGGGIETTGGSIVAVTGGSGDMAVEVPLPKGALEEKWLSSPVPKRLEKPEGERGKTVTVIGPPGTPVRKLVEFEGRGGK
jgi:hypothetical protein